VASKTEIHPEEYRRVREAAAEIAVAIGRSSGRGRPYRWRFREPPD
jgi:hypothetical protein